MAKNINHIQHKKSSVVENGLPKLPNSNVLVEGEIAVNFASGVETISLKNSSGEVVTFSSDNYFIDKKFGSGFTGENSGLTITEAIEEDELAISLAFQELDEKKLDVSAYTETDLSEYLTIANFEDKIGSGFTGENSGLTITKALEDNELAMSSALNDLNENKLDVSAYTETDLSDYYDKTEINDKLGSGFTGENSGVTVTEALLNVDIDVDQVIDSGTSASTNAVATQAVYNTIVDNELVWTNAYVVISGTIRTHTADTLIHRVDIVSKTEISSNSVVSCPGIITGVTNDGAQAVVIYENTSTTTDYTVTVASGYKTSNGSQISLTCPANGFCKVTYININGQIYASAN